MQNDTAIERTLRNPSHGGGVGTYEAQVQWIAHRPRDPATLRPSGGQFDTA